MTKGAPAGTSRRLLLVLLAGVLVSGVVAVFVGPRVDPARAAETSIATGLQTRTVERTVTIPDTEAPLPTPVAASAGNAKGEPVREIGTIEIPKIGLTHRVFHGITMRNIDLGPSHWPGTAFPGESGNAVFAGHRVTKTRPFRNIDQLVEGDLVHFTIEGVRSTYAVIGHKVVTPKALDIVAQTPTPTATLFACHPPGSARYRYVVTLGLVS